MHSATTQKAEKQGQIESDGLAKSLYFVILYILKDECS